MSKPSCWSNESDDWATPPELVEACNAIAPITLDVCADAYNAKAARWFDESTNGLIHSWAGEVCWMNPPYSATKEWLTKAVAEANNGCLVFALVPCRTETIWWWDLVANKATEIRFLKKRLSFVRGDGHTGSAPFPSAIAIYDWGKPLRRVCWWDWQTGEIVG